MDVADLIGNALPQGEDVTRILTVMISLTAIVTVAVVVLFA
jgi:hypothetical protein